MTDAFTQAKRSEVMSRIRSRGNRDTEGALAAVFRRHGIAGWRRQQRVRVGRRGTRVESQRALDARRSSLGSP